MNAMVADRAAYTRISDASRKVAAEAYMLAAEWEQDEPVPLWPTGAGLAVSRPEPAREIG